MITLYGKANTRSTRVAWALEEANATYEVVNIDLSLGEHKQAAYLKINPFGKIPALVDGDIILSESVAICHYIAEKFPDSGLIPSVSDLESRAMYHQWSLFIVSELENHLWTAARHVRILPQDKRVSAIIETSHWEFDKACEILSAHLEQNTYIAGEHFSAADILCASVLRWAAIEGISLNSILSEYKSRISKRPALKRARQRELDAANNTSNTI